MKSLLLSLTAAFCIEAAEISWSTLPPLPDPEGFAGSFAGTSGGSLIVAGGANFPDAPPWHGGAKKWYDTLFVLDRPGGEWRAARKLPAPKGYGVSITTPEGILCLGGCDATRHFREVFRLRLRLDGAMERDTLPPLPQPCAYMAGALLGRTVFLCGGTDCPDATSALPVLWSLDLDEAGAVWQEHPPCPGTPRILAVMGAHAGALHLFGGAALKPDADGKPAREWLRDAWRYSPEEGKWHRLADLPRAAVAAPGPAPSIGGRLLVIGGDDGVNVNFEPKEEHPGFPRDILAYDPVSDAWSRGGEVPFSLVTTTVVEWRGRIVIPGGEARPGKRSTQVWSSGH